MYQAVATRSLSLGACNPFVTISLSGQGQFVAPEEVDTFSLDGGYMDTRCLVAVTTKYHTVAPNICGPSLWNLLHVTLLVPRILRWLLDFWTVCTLHSLRAPSTAVVCLQGYLYILIIVLRNQLQ